MLNEKPAGLRSRYGQSPTSSSTRRIGRRERLTIPATIRAAIRRPIAGRAPYVIHNMAQRQRENDYFAFKKHMTVTGHYRFDASKVL